MKKFVIAMVVIIILGAVISGIGCTIYFTSDVRINSENIEYTEKSFETDNAFSKLNLNLRNAHKVTFERGEKCSVKYFDTNFTEFSISVQNDALVISESGWSWKNWIQQLFFKFRTTDVIITVPEGVTLDIVGKFQGATDLNLPAWEYGKIDLDASGASNIIARGINAQSIYLEMSGATNMSLSGKTDSIKIDASGAVQMRCDDLICPLINIQSSGSTELNLSGTGSVLTLHSSGSGKIWAKDFSLDRAEIDASGSVDAELAVSTYLKVDASGYSKISYWGDAQVEKHTSDSSSIVKKG